MVNFLGAFPQKENGPGAGSVALGTKKRLKGKKEGKIE